MFLGSFMGDIDELNLEVFNQELVNMFKLFDRSDQTKKLFEKYKFCLLLHVKMKLKTN